MRSLERKIKLTRLDRNKNTVQAIQGLPISKLLTGNYWKFFPDQVAAVLVASPENWFKLGRKKQLWILAATRAVSLAKISYFDRFPKNISNEFIVWFLSLHENPMTVAACIGDILHGARVDRIIIAEKLMRAYNPCVREMICKLIFQPGVSTTRTVVHKYALLDYIVDDVTAGIIITKIYVNAQTPKDYVICLLILQKYPNAIDHISMGDLSFIRTDNPFIKKVIDKLKPDMMKKIVNRCVKYNDNIVGIEFLTKWVNIIFNSEEEMKLIYKYPSKFKDFIEYLECLLKRYTMGRNWYINKKPAYKMRRRHRRKYMHMYGEIKHIISNETVCLEYIELTDKLITECLSIMSTVNNSYRNKMVKRYEVEV